MNQIKMNQINKMVDHVNKTKSERDTDFLVFSMLCKFKKIDNAKKILETVDIFNFETLSQDTYLLKAVEGDISLVEYIINHKKCTQKYFLKQNMFGFYCLNHSIKHNPKCFFILSKSKFFTKSVFKIKSKTNKTLLHYACMKGRLNIVKFLINNKWCTKDYINSQDDRKNTCLGYAINCSEKCALFLLDSKWQSTQMLSIYNNLGQNALLLACRYSKKICKKILKSKYMTKKIMNQKSNGYCTPLIYAILLNKSLIKHILKSKYCTKEMFQTITSEQTTCLYDAITNDCSLKYTASNTSF